MSVRGLGACLFSIMMFALVLPASGSEPSITALRQPAGDLREAVEKAAAAKGLSDIVLFADHSFLLTAGQRTLQLFSGKGVGQDLRSICFVVTMAGNSAHFLPTIGSGDYDATECRGVHDTKIVGSPRWLLIVYDSVSPNYSVKEPIVIAIGEGQPAAIDVEASRVLSLAGVTTSEAAAKLLRKK